MALPLRSAALHAQRGDTAGDSLSAQPTVVADATDTVLPSASSMPLPALRALLPLAAEPWSELLQRQRGWLIGAALLLAGGLLLGQPLLIAGALALLLGLTIVGLWWQRHRVRLKRMRRAFALGDWHAVRVLARELRGFSAHRPAIDFELDVMLAGVYARERSLGEALARLDEWRKRFVRRPGHFDSRLAAVHLMAGDSAGYLARMSAAHLLEPSVPVRRIDLALAEARFGDGERVEPLLAGLAPVRLRRPQLVGCWHWARGLLALRRGEVQDARRELTQALTTLQTTLRNPASWPLMAACACDHAIALAECGERDAARAQLQEVWPVLQVHATVPHLSMLHADGLLPAAPRDP